MVCRVCYGAVDEGAGTCRAGHPMEHAPCPPPRVAVAPERIRPATDNPRARPVESTPPKRPEPKDAPPLVDPYATLGVARNASDYDVRKAFRKAAAGCHPDRGGDELRFRQLGAAQDVLLDPARRQAFDIFGPAALRPDFDPRAHAQAAARPRAEPSRAARYGAPVVPAAEAFARGTVAANDYFQTAEGQQRAVEFLEYLFGTRPHR
jgi:hypothetical protein